MKWGGGALMHMKLQQLFLVPESDRLRGVIVFSSNIGTPTFSRFVSLNLQ